jgi:hypothetical protein
MTPKPEQLLINHHAWRPGIKMRPCGLACLHWSGQVLWHLMQNHSCVLRIRVNIVFRGHVLRCRPSSCSFLSTNLFLALRGVPCNMGSSGLNKKEH